MHLLEHLAALAAHRRDVPVDVGLWLRRRSPGRRRSAGARGRPCAARPSHRAASPAHGRRHPPARTARAAPSSAGRRCRTPMRRTSATTCSTSADESTIIAFWPPVSAISVTARPRLSTRPATLRCRMRATSVEPVNITPIVLASSTSAAPTVSPRPGNSCNAPRGTPASHSVRTASAAISAVCSAGLASTVLPAASAAATWPTKIASGKFQGLMQTTGPSGSCDALLNSLRACSA